MRRALGGLAVLGDEEHRFLFARPNRFVFGSYVQYFFVRADMPLAPPEAEMVSWVVLTVEGREEGINNGDLIAVLLKAYTGGAEQAEPARGETVDFTLTLYHRDYPFLAAEIRGAVERQYRLGLLLWRRQRAV